MPSVRTQRRNKLGALHINNKIVPVYEGLNTIGRNKEATVIVKDAGISHHHAVLTIVNEDLHFISDFQSSNGTTVDGIKLVPYELKSIKDGSVILFSLNIRAVYKKINGDVSTFEQENNQNSQNTQTQDSSTFYEARTQQFTDTFQNSPNVSTFQPTKKPDLLFDDGYDFAGVSTQICDALTQVANIHEMSTQIISVNNSINNSNINIHEAITPTINHPIKKSPNLIPIHEAATQIVERIPTEEVVIESNLDDDATQITSYDPNPSIHDAETQIVLENANDVINTHVEVVSEPQDDEETHIVEHIGISSIHEEATQIITECNDINSIGIEQVIDDQATQVMPSQNTIPLECNGSSTDSDRLSQLHTSQLRRKPRNKHLDSNEDDTICKVTPDHSYITDSDPQTQLHTSQLHFKFRNRLLSDSGSSTKTQIHDNEHNVETDNKDNAGTVSINEMDDSSNGSEDFCRGANACEEIAVATNTPDIQTTEVVVQDKIDSDADTDVEEALPCSSTMSNVQALPNAMSVNTNDPTILDDNTEVIIENKVNSDDDTDVEEASHCSNRKSNIQDLPNDNNRNKPTVELEISLQNKLDSDTEVDDVLPHCSTRISGIQQDSSKAVNDSSLIREIQPVIDNVMNFDESSNDSTDFFKGNCARSTCDSPILNKTNPSTSAPMQQISELKTLVGAQNVSTQRVSDTESSDEGSSVSKRKKKLISISTDTDSDVKKPALSSGDHRSTRKGKLRKKRSIPAKKWVIESSGSDTDVDGNLTYNSKFKVSVGNSSSTDMETSFVGRKSSLDITTDVIPCTQECFNKSDDDDDVIPATQQVDIKSSSEDTFKLDLTQYMEEGLKEQATKLSTFRKIQENIVSDTEELYVIKGLDTQDMDSDSDDLMNTKVEVASTSKISQIDNLSSTVKKSSIKTLEVKNITIIDKGASTVSDKNKSKNDFNFVAPTPKIRPTDLNEIDYEAPTQKMVSDMPDSSNNKSLNNTDFDFEAPTQKLTDRSIEINKSNSFNDSEFDFGAPTQKLIQSDNGIQNMNELDDSNIVAPTQDLLESNKSRHKNVNEADTDKLKDGNRDKLSKVISDTEFDFAAPTQKLIQSDNDMNELDDSDIVAPMQDLLESNTSQHKKNNVDFDAETEKLIDSNKKKSKDIHNSEFNFTVPTQKLIPPQDVSGDTNQFDFASPTQKILEANTSKQKSNIQENIDFEAETEKMLDNNGDITNQNKDTEFDFGAPTQILLEANTIKQKSSIQENIYFEAETEKLLDNTGDKTDQNKDTDTRDVAAPTLVDSECIFIPLAKELKTSRNNKLNNTDFDFNASTQKIINIKEEQESTIKDFEQTLNKLYDKILDQTDCDFNATTQKIIDENKELERSEEIKHPNVAAEIELSLDDEELILNDREEIAPKTVDSHLEIVETPVIKKKKVSFGSVRSESNDEIDNIEPVVDRPKVNQQSVDQLENKLHTLFATPCTTNHVKSLVSAAVLSTQDVIEQLISDPAPSKKRPSDESDDKSKSKKSKKNISDSKELPKRRLTRKATKIKASVEEKIEPNKDVTNNNVVKQISSPSTSKTNHSLLDCFNMNNIKRTNISKLSTIKSTSNVEDEEESDSLTCEDDDIIITTNQALQNKTTSEISTKKETNDSKDKKMNQVNKSNIAQNRDSNVSSRKTRGSKTSNVEHVEVSNKVQNLTNVGKSSMVENNPIEATKDDNIFNEVTNEDSNTARTSSRSTRSKVNYADEPARRPTRSTRQTKKVDESSESTIDEKPVRTRKAAVDKNTDETSESNIKTKPTRGKRTRTNNEEANKSKKTRKDESDEEDAFSVSVPRRQIMLQISDADSDNAANDERQKDRTIDGKSFTKSNSTISSNISIASTSSRKGNNTIGAANAERCKRKLKPKVVFTMLNSPELCTVIRGLGGMVVDSLETSTVLVTKSVQRSQKLLCAISLNKPICSPTWLYKSQKQHAFGDPWDNLIEDDEAETKWNFSLKESFRRSSKKKLYEGLQFQIVTTNAVEMLKAVIEASGGKCVARTSKISNFIVIAAADKKEKYSKYLKQNIKVVAAEAIFDGVLRQEITFDKHLLT